MNSIQELEQRARELREQAAEERRPWVSSRLKGLAIGMEGRANHMRRLARRTHIPDNDAMDNSGENG